MGMIARKAGLLGFAHRKIFRSLAAAAGLALLAAALSAGISAPAGAATTGPVVLSVSSHSGPVTGGTPISITGSGFTTGATVRLDQGNSPGPNAIPATNINVVSPTQITATTGRGAKLGSLNVFVTTGAGTSASNAADTYSYTASPAFGTAAVLPGSPGGSGVFYGVSCADASDCTAVGQAYDSLGNSQGLIVTETGGTWGTPTAIPLPGGEEGGEFFSVSCTDASDCTAVGVDGNAQPFYLTETGGTWGTPTEIPSPGGGAFYSVSCTDASDCTAVGSWNNENVYVTETGGTWGTPTAIPPAPGDTFGINSVSCTDASDCTAIGTGAVGTRSELFYVTETGGTWGTTTEIPDSPGGEAEGFAVSCTDASDCTAVGYDGNDQPFYVTETGGTWGTPTDIVGSPGGSGTFSGVSCTDASDCTAVGQAPNGGLRQPIYATETNGSWGPITEVPGPSGGDNYFYDVSCTDASDCTAVGYEANSQAMDAASSTGTKQPSYARESIPPVPKVSAVSPHAGPVKGGTAITITGTGFVPGALVEISQGYGPGPTAILATKVRVVSRTQIKATTGRATKAGRYAVFVLTPGGTNPTPPKAGLYTYQS